MASSNSTGFTSFKRLPYLQVKSGIHAGTSVAINAAACRIGTSDQNDIVLGDSGVESQHMVVRIYGGQVAIEATGGEVCAEGQPIVQGSGQRVNLPVTVELGDVRLHLARDKLFELSSFIPSPTTRARLNKGAAATAVVAIVAGLLYSTFDLNQAMASVYREHGLMTAVGDSHAPAANRRRKGRQQTSRAEPSAHDNSLENGAKTAIRALKTRLAINGLDSLRVENSGHSIAVTGTVPTSARSKWTGTEKWFDSHFGNRQVLVSSVEIVDKAEVPDLHFTAAWFGRHPYVVDGSGARRYPGAALGNGWVLDNLNNNRITVRRNGRKFSFTL